VDPDIRRFEDREEEVEEEKTRQRQLIDRIKKRYDSKPPIVNPKN